MHLKSVILSLAAVALVGCGDAGEDDGGDSAAVDRSVYPDGPYGVDVDDVMANLEFTTADGDPLSFADLRGDETAHLLLISTAAEWCTACREEQPLLQSLADDYEGLVVMVSIFEDADYTPAGVDEASTWRDQYELSFPVVADPDFVLADYYDETLTPMNMLVDLDTMKIGYVTTGAIDDQFVSLVDTLLSGR